MKTTLSCFEIWENCFSAISRALLNRFSCALSCFFPLFLTAFLGEDFYALSKIWDWLYVHMHDVLTPPNRAITVISINRYVDHWNLFPNLINPLRFVDEVNYHSTHFSVLKNSWSCYVSDFQKVACLLVRVVFWHSSSFFSGYHIFLIHKFLSRIWNDRNLPCYLPIIDSLIFDCIERACYDISVFKAQESWVM